MEVRRAANDELFSLKGARTEVLDCSIMGLAAVSPRVTFSGSIVKDRIAFTQSFDYHFERTPVDSLPPLQSDSRLESDWREVRSFHNFGKCLLAVDQPSPAGASSLLFFTLETRNWSI